MSINLFLPVYPASLLSPKATAYNLWSSFKGLTRRPTDHFPYLSPRMSRALWYCLCFQVSAMADLLQPVCCLCGDVGFPTELFRCVKCCNRFQHSYCSNYYGESTDPIELCDWCRSEERSGRMHRPRGSARKSAANNDNRVPDLHECSGSKITQHRHDDSSEKAKNTDGGPSPRSTTRRYKLLKDVMC